jgi:TRAP-type C4-dicarboxylate transport system substrate-binding protein
MRWTRRTFIASTLALLATPAILRRARADAPQLTLKLHHSFSAVSAVHEKFLAPWARKVEADSGGRIRIDLFPSMQLGGAPAHLFDQARDGVADIVWAVPSATPGRFPKSEAFELPFVLSHRALVNSKALEDFAAANLQDEFREFHPLCFSCRDHGVLHTARAIKSIGDLKGLRLHVPNRLAAESVHALGAQGVSVPTPQVPMAISARAIDGCLDPWDAVPGLRLNDSLKNHTDFAEQALSSATFVLAMNRQAYDRLPRDLKTVIDNNAGQPAASMAGAMWDLEAKAVAGAARDRGEPVVVISGEEMAPWRKATEPVIAAWHKQMKERKLDGDKLLADVHALLANYAEEPEPEPPQAPRPVEQPGEQQAVTEPPQTAEPRSHGFRRPRADAPAVEAAAPPTSAAQPSSMPPSATPTPSPSAPPAPSPTASAAPTVPAAKPAPAPVAAPKLKELDIPL